MSEISVDSNNYLFFEEESFRYSFKHKYLVPSSYNETSTDPEEWLGEEEKWSKWTTLNAREYSSEYNVSIIKTRKKILTKG